MSRPFLILVVVPILYFGYLKWEFSDRNIQRVVREIQAQRDQFENEAIYLDSVSASGKEIHYKFVFRGDSSKVDWQKVPDEMAEMKRLLKKNYLCDNNNAKLVLRHGFAVVFDVRTEDKAKLGKFEINMKDCGLSPPLFADLLW